MTENEIGTAIIENSIQLHRELARFFAKNGLRDEAA